jgi:hypothetical protein
MQSTQKQLQTYWAITKKCIFFNTARSVIDNAHKILKQNPWRWNSPICEYMCNQTVVFHCKANVIFVHYSAQVLPFCHYVCLVCPENCCPTLPKTFPLKRSNMPSLVFWWQGQKQKSYGMSFMALILWLKWSGLKQNYELTNLHQTTNHRWFPPQSMQKEALSYHDKNCTQRDSICDRYHILACKRSVVNNKLQQHIDMHNVHANTWYYQYSYISRMFKVTEGSIFYKTSLQHALY